MMPFRKQRVFKRLLLRSRDKLTEFYMQRLSVKWRYVAVVTGLVACWSLNAQEVPSRPLSIPVYHPMVLIPGYAGSKDYAKFGLTSRIYKVPDNQIISFHQRMNGSNGVFSNFGIGGYFFQEQFDTYWNTGLAAVGAYHYPVDKARLHNISVGATLKGILNVPKKQPEIPDDSLNSSFKPNMDLGLYYYGPSAFAGISVTTLFGTRLDDGLTVDDPAYIPRAYNFYGGYKFLLSRKNSIVLEPSLLISVNDSTFSELHRHMVPYLKIYLQNFYIGTYVKSKDIFALFFQYQFPRFYAGVFLEFPRVGFLNEDNIIFEVSLGVNLGTGDQRFLQFRHW
jgi:type IX secretion system PorP/SprF family membrane protein